MRPAALNARVLVVTRQEGWRDRLWEQIEEIGASMGSALESLSDLGRR